MAVHVVGDDLRGEERCARRRADVGDDIAGLHIIAAEAAACGKVALDEGYIVVIPEGAHGVVVKVQRHAAVLCVEDRAAELLGADEHVVRHRVAAEERASIVRDIGRLRVGPLVVVFGDGDEAFDRGQVVIGCACGGGERLPVRFIEKQQLRRLGDGEDLDAARAGEVAFAQIVLNKGGAVLFA